MSEPETLVRAALSAHLDDLDVPTGDLSRAMREGGRTRRRRHIGLVSATAVAAAGVVGAVLVLGPGVGTGSGEADVATFPSVGAIDASHGLRAFTAPGEPVSLGGRTFASDDLDFLDTDAIATTEGMVFYDRGRPYLLGLDGESEPLVDGPVDDEPGFHPTAKADTEGGVAVATTTDGAVTIRVVSASGTATSTRARCGRVCDSLVIDAYDDGVVWGHTEAGTFALGALFGGWQDMGGADGFRVVDVRNGVVLHTGPAPDDLVLLEGFSATRTRSSDATLTLDGTHVLDWQPVLQPTDAGSGDAGPAPLRLDLPGGRADQLGFFALDTDGSVLAAVTADYPHFTVYDCALTGGCELIGTLDRGDPIFLGADM